MTQTEIRTRIAEILAYNGFYVCASEVDEGFKKPAVFVNVTHSQHTRLMNGMEEVSENFEIKYIPAVETAAECVKTADKLFELFYYSPIDVCGCKLTVESVETETDEYILYFRFGVNYQQIMPYDDDYEEMKDLELEV